MTALLAIPPLALADSLPQGLEWLSLLLSYLLGAVPFGFLMARHFAGVDLREVGSGNIGASNAVRVLGKPLGFVAGLLDFAKGWLPAFFLAGLFSAGEPSLALRVGCGAAAVCGHVWPVFLGFKGGKAVATGSGALIALDWVVFAIGAAVWLLTLLVFRYAGLASIAMCTAYPLAAWWRVESGHGGYELVWGTLGLMVLVLFRHRANIRRMRSGTEPRAGTRQSSNEQESHA